MYSVCAPLAAVVWTLAIAPQVTLSFAINQQPIGGLVPGNLNVYLNPMLQLAQVIP